MGCQKKTTVVSNPLIEHNSNWMLPEHETHPFSLARFRKHGAHLGNNIRKTDLVVTNTLRHHQTIAICISLYIYVYTIPYITLSRDHRRRPRHCRHRRSHRRRCRPGHVAMSSSCRRHVVAMSSPCRRHVVAMSSPCGRRVVAMSSQCRRQAVAMWSPCRRHVVAMPSRCCHHAMGMSSSCRRHLHQLSLPQTPWYILETSAHRLLESR